jgi:integrase
MADVVLRTPLQKKELKDLRTLLDRARVAAKPGKQKVVLEDGMVPGFGLRVSGKGKLTYVLLTRFPGGANPVPRTIAVCGTLEMKLSDEAGRALSDARTTAVAWLKDIGAGVDPARKKAESKTAEETRQAYTFEVAFKQFTEEHLSTLRTGEAVAAVVRKHVYPILGERPLTDIRRGDVNELIRALRLKTPTNANRILSYLKRFFGWAVDLEKIEASPASLVRRPSKEISRDRVLGDTEIRAIWRASEGLGPFGRCVQFMLLTGARRSEAGEVSWTEIDSKKRLWTLPRTRAKNNREHLIPLSDMAMQIFDRCPRTEAEAGIIQQIDALAANEALALRASVNGSSPTRCTKARDALLDELAKIRAAAPESKTLRFVFSTMRRGDRAIAGWGRFKVGLDEAVLEELRATAKENGEDPSSVKLEPWILHDARRSVATNLAKLEVDRVVISKILNHTIPGVTGIYDRHDRHNERRQALDKWSQRLSAIINASRQPTDENVVRPAVWG